MARRPRIEKLIEIIVYLASKAPIPDLYHVGKLTYFADKNHLSEGGRFVSDDIYVAMDKGPVPSTIYDIVKFVRGDNLAFDCRYLEGAKEALEINGHSIKPLREPNLNLLSISDIRCLDNAIAQYGNLSFTELKELSHDSAYEKATPNAEIPIEDIAMTLPNGEEIVEYLNM